MTPASRRLRVVSLLLIVFAVQKFALYGAKGYFIRAPQDFASYYLAAKGFLRGLNPYDTERLWSTFGLDAGVFHPFLYPPSSLLAVLGLTILPPRAAGILFLVGSAAFLGVALYCFARIFFDRRVALTLAIVGFAFQPVTSTFLIGQINSLVLGLTALAIYFETRERDGRAALCVALGIALKLTPVFLLLYYVLRRKHALFFKTLGWLAALLVVSVAVFGWDLHLAYLQHFSRGGSGGIAGTEPGWLAGHAVAAFENQGLNGFLSRLLVPSYVSEALLPRPQQFDLVFRTIAGLIVLASCWAAFRTESQYRALSIVLCLSLLVTPISWYHTFGTLYLILIILLRDILADARARALTWAGVFFLVLFFHGGTSNIASILDPSNYRTGLRSLALSLPFFWLLALWLTLVVTPAMSDSTSVRNRV
jgi:alpha-1,2-mannosyltransferase